MLLKLSNKSSLNAFVEALKFLLVVSSFVLSTITESFSEENNTENKINEDIVRNVCYFIPMRLTLFIFC